MIQYIYKNVRSSNMKKLVSLTVLTMLVTACSDYGTSNNNMNAGYGPDGLAEESLETTTSTANVPVAADNSLNDTYLLSAAPKYYIGSAYKVEDVQYTPIEDLSYNQTGIAGIIPTELNGSKTSNGEVFNADQMVATSKTLPLPTIVRVTNLDNGMSTVVRVNNRGPFVNTRIMDVSPAVANKIGISGQAKVQVQVVTDKSIAVKNATMGTTANVAPAPIIATPVTMAPAPQPTVAPIANGNYSVQVAAFYAEDSAASLSQKMQTYGDAIVIKESDMYKVRIINLDAPKARSVIDTLRSNEGMAPGLLNNGKWVNADSI